MWHAWNRGEILTGFYWEVRREETIVKTKA